MTTETMVCCALIYLIVRGQFSDRVARQTATTSESQTSETTSTSESQTSTSETTSATMTSSTSETEVCRAYYLPIPKPDLIQLSFLLDNFRDSDDVEFRNRDFYKRNGDIHLGNNDFFDVRD